MDFALLGAAGYVAPRHMAAIDATGNRIVAVVDPNNAGTIGGVDRYSFDAEYFRSMDELRESMSAGTIGRLDYVSVCTPNDLHFSHCRAALRLGADVICEKPLVIDPAHLDDLAATESDTGRRVFVIQQSRLHPSIIALRDELLAGDPAVRHEVRLTFVLPRGKWYRHSWKAQDQHSGGVALHMGVHVFDLLLWLFGAVEESRVHLRQEQRMGGSLVLSRANVTWLLSTDTVDLGRGPSVSPLCLRSVTVDGREVDFSDGAGLHERAYREVLAGRGYGIEDARPAIELVHQMCVAPVMAAVS